MTDQPDLEQVPSRVLGPAEAEVGCDACFDELDRDLVAREGSDG